MNQSNISLVWGVAGGVGGLVGGGGGGGGGGLTNFRWFVVDEWKDQCL